MLVTSCEPSAAHTASASRLTAKRPGRQVRRALERLLARQVVAALAGLCRGGLRGAVEPALGALLGTLHLASAIPALSVRVPWQPPAPCPAAPRLCTRA